MYEDEAVKVRENFLRDVRNHKLHVMVDGDSPRLTFRRPKTNVHYFGIVTWPYHLCIYGDMGEYVFHHPGHYRMINFFRTDDLAKIQPRYWEEKLRATDKQGGHREFSRKSYRDAIMQYFENWDEDDSFEDDYERTKVKESLEELASDGAYENSTLLAHHAAYEWEIKVNGTRYQLDDFWESDVEDYTYHYIWCLYAIVWGIQQYDAWKEEQEDV